MEWFPEYFQGGAYVRSFCHAHSDPLNRMAETGMLGVLGMLWMWGVLLLMGIRLWRLKSNEPIIMVGRGAAIGLLALWVAGWSQCYYTDAEVGALWWFMVGLMGLVYIEST